MRNFLKIFTHDLNRTPVFGSRVHNSNHIAMCPKPLAFCHRYRFANINSWLPSSPVWINKYIHTHTHTYIQNLCLKEIANQKMVIGCIGRLIRASAAQSFKVIAHQVVVKAQCMSSFNVPGGFKVLPLTGHLVYVPLLLGELSG